MKKYIKPEVTVVVMQSYNMLMASGINNSYSDGAQLSREDGCWDDDE